MCFVYVQALSVGKQSNKNRSNGSVVDAINFARALITHTQIEHTPCALGITVGSGYIAATIKKRTFNVLQLPSTT